MLKRHLAHKKRFILTPTAVKPLRGVFSRLYLKIKQGFTPTRFLSWVRQCRTARRAMTGKGWGFTIVEALVSIAILSLALGAALTLMQQSADQLNRSKLRMTATYLANEGIEIVREVRDTNQLNGSDWDEGFASGVNCRGNGCRVSMLDSTGSVAHPPEIQVCTGSCTVDTSFFRLQTNSSNMYGHYGVGTDTRFYRKLQLTNVPGGEQYLVTISLYYEKGGESETITVEEAIRKTIP